MIAPSPTAPAAPSLKLAVAEPSPTATEAVPAATTVVVSATTVPSAPANAAAATSFSGPVIAALIAATVTAGIAVWTARRKSREEERARQRTVFADAFKAYADYKEMPYAIRRRRHDEPAEERVRLSEIVRDVQGRLSYHTFWTAAESPVVGDAYARLVAEVRVIAGGAMREAWQATPITEDSQMNFNRPLLESTSLEPLEKAFLAASQAHLEAVASRWPRRRSQRPSELDHGNEGVGTPG